MQEKLSKEDILKQLGVKPEDAVTIKYATWQPWNRDDNEHADDPQGFRGKYAGYKVGSKMLSGKKSVFDMFGFDGATPPAPGGMGWLVASSFQLEELKRVEPGTEIVIIYLGSEKNIHGGNTPQVEWYFANPNDRKTRVSREILPPSNAEKLKLLPANGSPGDGDGEIPF